MRQGIPERLVHELALSLGDSANPIGNWSDKRFDGAGVGPLRQASEDLGEIDAGIAMHDLGKYFEQHVMAKLAGLTGKLVSSVFVMFRQCGNEAVKENTLAASCSLSEKI